MYIFVNYVEEKHVSTDQTTGSPPNSDQMQTNELSINLIESPTVQLVLCKKNVLLEVDQSDTIKQVKLRIEQQEGILADQSVLAFKLQLLDDDALVGDLKFIQNETVIKLFPKNILIFYKTLDGQLKQLKVKSIDTVGEVKDKIKLNEGIARKSFALAYGDFELDDNRTLLSYGIHQCLTLQTISKWPVWCSSVVIDW